MASKSPCFCCCSLTHGSGEIILLVSFKFTSVLPAMCKSEVTDVQKFIFVQKNIHLAAELDIKKE